MVRAITPHRDAWHALRLAALLCDRRIDVVHTHSSKAGALGRAAAFLCSGAVRVHTPHTYAFSFEGGAGQGGQSAGPPGLVLRLERLLGHVSDRLIHVSESELREGQALGVVAAARARVIPNGIDPTRYAHPRGGESLRQALGIPAGAPVVGTIGLLNDAKGHDLLVAAAAQLTPDVHVLIVGHGEREAALRAQADRIGLGPRLHLPGWRDDLSAVHAALSVFALPSRWEGLPYALLEALAAGLPCVATDVNGSRDILQCEPPCGLLVPREDPAALAAALSRLLGDAALRERFAAAGRARVQAEYTVERMLDRTLQLYREALEDRGARGARSSGPRGPGPHEPRAPGPEARAA
jgi:glycosyltransferase involved in cell wall biosynthesis